MEYEICFRNANQATPIKCISTDNVTVSVYSFLGLFLTGLTFPRIIYILRGVLLVSLSLQSALANYT